MDFSDIIADLSKLEGIRLNSIRPGAEITIKQVDTVQKKVIVESSSGKLQSRSFFEFQRIWEALLASPAIRVEEVLNGSGSSRNQPETIFANLPYIQWLKINNKKHIAYVGKPSHPYGTIQQMDSMSAAQIIETQKKENMSTCETVLVVTDDVAQTAKTITTVLGKQSEATAEGYYVYRFSTRRIVLADSKKADLISGTYIEVEPKSSFFYEKKIAFLGCTWGVFSENNFNTIVCL